MANPKKYRVLRIIGRIFLVLLLLFLLVVLFIRSEWGQNLIVGKATDFIENKTGTRVEIDRLYLTFSGNLMVEGLYLEDQKGDTLVYSQALEANVPLSPKAFRNTLSLKSATWTGLKARIFRGADTEDFNFTFLIDAFAAADTTTIDTTNTEPMTFSIGTLDFQDFDVIYTDGYMGLDTRLKLGKLEANVDNFDLETMRFEVDEFHLQDVSLSYEQSKPFPKTEDTTTTQLPFLRVDDFTLANIEANYKSKPDGLDMNFKIHDFGLELPKADLAANQFEVDLLRLQNSRIDIQQASQDISVKKSDSLTVEMVQPFSWPEFLIDIKEIDLAENDLVFQTGNRDSIPNGFNPEDIQLSNLGLQASNVSYRPKDVQLALENLTFSEQSGFGIKEAQFQARLNNEMASLTDLKLQTLHSALVGDINLNFSSFDDFLKNPELTSVDVSIDDAQLGLADVYVFQPNVKTNQYLNDASELPISAELIANGTLGNLNVPHFQLHWGKETNLETEARLSNLMTPDSLGFEFNDIKFATTQKDINRLVNEDSLGISIPKKIYLKAKAVGSVQDSRADLKLTTTDGNLSLKGSYSTISRIAFRAKIDIDSLQLQKILKNEQLGPVSGTMNADGQGKDLNSLDASLTSNFTQLQLRKYDFSNLIFNGQIKNGDGEVEMNFKDENLNFTSTTGIVLDSANTQLNVDLKVIGADLYALGITKENIKAAVDLNATYTGNAEDFEVDALFKEGIAVYENEQYQMGDLRLNAIIGEEDTNVSVESDFLNGQLKSNASPAMVTDALTKQFQSYFTENKSQDSVTNPVNLDVNFSLSPVPILTQVFLNGVERLDSVHVRANFDSKAKSLQGRVHLPSIVYQGNSLDSLEVSVMGTPTDLNLSAGFGALMAGPVNVKKTFLEGKLQNKELLLDFNSFDDQEQLMHVASEMVLERDSISLHINPDKLLFNKKEWQIPGENKISIAENHLDLSYVVFSRNNQELSLSTSLPEIEKEHLGIVFSNFKLQTFVSLLNPDEALASGEVKGRLVVENPFTAPGIVANFNIANLGVMDNPLGNLALDAQSKGQANYDFDLSLKDGGVDLDLTGDYAAAETGAKLNLDLDLNTLELKVLEGLSEGQIKDTQGYISGKVALNGTTVEPIYEGELQFNDTQFNIATFNSLFKVNGESLTINNEGIAFDTFSVKDDYKGTFELDGKIHTENITNPAFDLNVKANEFRVLNSTKEDNELYYGTASIDADVDISGDLDLPEIDGRLKIRKVTDVTYVVPEAQLDVEERDGVVIFVNKENPDAILTRNDQEETAPIFQGFDLSSVLEIANDAVFHIIIDERTGDNLQVSGDAELNLNMSPNGRINLTGRYELKDGHYETSLYNLVNRRFTIKPGGSITWRGDPTDAALDVTAIYEVETSAAPLMAAVTSGQDVSVTGKYQQVLPFLVYLNVDGELLKPELSFDLDMPEDEQGSLGGAVYGRVQQLNEQEAALNKQVFSLLALNRFFPDSGSDGSAGGTAALARNNVNKVLSGQLNAFSDKVFGKTGFEVDFDLDSFTDYQGDGPQDRTQLNINAKKKLFDDRLVVTAGSAVDVEGSAQAGQEQTPIIGNVSLEYLLTQDGIYRLRGYRKNEYENVIDGQLIVTGLALIFNREFNNFSQLFSPLDDEKGEKPKEKEKE